MLGGWRCKRQPEVHQKVAELAGSRFTPVALRQALFAPRRRSGVGGAHVANVACYK